MPCATEPNGPAAPAKLATTDVLRAAEELAAQGKLEDAETLLRQLGDPPPDFDAALLTAKVLAQRGRHRDASQHWRNALRLKPDSDEAAEGLGLSVHLLKGGLPGLYLRANVVIACLACLAVCLGIVAWLFATGRQPEREARSPATAATNANIPATPSTTFESSAASPTVLTSKPPSPAAVTTSAPSFWNNFESKLARLSDQVSAMQAKLDAATQRPQSPQPAPAAAPQPTGPKVIESPLSFEGVTLRRDARKGLTVVFSDGLFSEGARLTHAASRLLERLAAAVAAQDPRVSVEIVGFSDQVPFHHDGDHVLLGFQRASVVAARLGQHPNLPPARFSIRSQGQNALPFPDSPNNWHRNRTVIIHLRWAPEDPP